MDGPDLWEALRRSGVDADDADVRAAVRAAFESVEGVRERSGVLAARRCAQAVQAALAYQLRHPDTADMSSFEYDPGTADMSSFEDDVDDEGEG